MASDARAESGDDGLAVAIGRYVLGEISLGNAAESVDMTRWEFEQVLKEAGFDALYGPRTHNQLVDEIDSALDHE